MCPIFDNLGFKKLIEEGYSFLIAPLSHVEIKAIIDSYDSQKALGPDDFSFKFIKSSWDVIKVDIYNIVEDFRSSYRLPRGSNNAFIALIPKINSPTSFKDFRPISMVGGVCKIATKLLVRHLQAVMNNLISSFQSSFIKGRQIQDGAL